MTVAKEFGCKCSQTQLMFVFFNTGMGWTTFTATFGFKEIEKVCIAWQNEGWTKVTTAKNWEKVKGQVIKQPSPEENEGFSCCLVMEIEEQ